MLAVLDTTKEDTGYVYHWTRQNGFERLINTDGAFPNGVELSNDESNLFINYAFGNKISKYNLSSKTIEASFNMNGIQTILQSTAITYGWVPKITAAWIH